MHIMHTTLERVVVRVVLLEPSSMHNRPLGTVIDCVVPTNGSLITNTYDLGHFTGLGGKRSAT